MKTVRLLPVVTGLWTGACLVPIGELGGDPNDPLANILAFGLILISAFGVALLYGGRAAVRWLRRNTTRSTTRGGKGSAAAWFLGGAAVPIIVAAAVAQGPAPLAGLSWRDETPSWSPDGREIVFASNRADPKSSTEQLYVMKADGTTVRRLTWEGRDSREPSFSPDRKWIVYAGNVLDASDDFTEAGEIFAVSADGSRVRFLTSGLGGDANLPTWSPNGRWIAFVDDVNPRTMLDDRVDLYVMRPDGGQRHRVAANIGDWALAWSPDSKAIVVSGPDGSLHRARVDAAKPIRLRGDGWRNVITDIAWSPDGSKIAFVRGARTLDGSGDVSPRYLWVRDLNSGKTHRLREVIDSSSVDFFGTTITWLRGHKPTLAVFDGERTDLITANGRRRGSLATTSWGGLSPGGASPDGKKLLFVDGPSGSDAAAIFVGSLRSRRIRQLTQTAS